MMIPLDLVLLAREVAPAFLGIYPPLLLPPSSNLPNMCLVRHSHNQGKFIEGPLACSLI